MHHRPMAIGALLLACILSLAGCNGDDPEPTASSSAPTAAPPTSASPSPSGSPTRSLTPAEQDLQSAGDAITDYWRVLDEVASDPKISLNVLATVARVSGA